MTEEYKIPTDFYKEEIRCDFTVTSKRKKVWAIQLKILNVFKTICLKHNLKYCAVGGTLLGAVRHRGYIPWDDDIDVGMPRVDFERFLSIVKIELKNNPDLIIQYETFDSNYASPHARITNVNTTAYFPHIWKAGIDVPQGIFIDIFPYDNVPNSSWKKNIHRFVYKSIAYMLHDKQHLYTYENFSISARILRLCSRILFLFTNVDNVFKWSQRYIQKYNSDLSCQHFGCISSFYQIEKGIMRKEWFDEMIELPFENMHIFCPKNYDRILTHQYGDWSKFVKGGSLHEGCFFDPDRPYTFYRNKYTSGIMNDM